MELTFTWLPFANSVAPNEEGLINVIKTLHYRKSASYIDENSVEHIVDTYGTVDLSEPHESTYLPYEQVTKQNRIDWTESVLAAQGKDLDAILEAQMEEKINPKIVNNYPIPEESSN